MVAKRMPNKLPSWHGTFELWSRNWVRKHYWRVAERFGSEEDGLQECALVFSRCINNYKESRVDNHAWFMSLYKTAIFNHWNTASVKSTQGRDMIACHIEDTEGFMDIEDKADGGLSHLIERLKCAGPDILEILQRLADAPNDSLAFLFRKPLAMQERLRIERFTQANDAFMIECIRNFIHYKTSRASERLEIKEVVANLAKLLAE